MSRVMTIGEYVREAEMFEYSKEYFDLIKEANEVELMGIYLAANDFLVENQDYDKDVLISVSRMFMEADSSAAAPLNSNVDTKPIETPAAAPASGQPLPSSVSNPIKDSFIQKIWNGILKVLGIISKPFIAISSTLKTFVKKYSDEAVISKLDSIIEEIKNKELTPEQRASLAASLKELKENNPELYKTYIDENRKIKRDAKILAKINGAARALKLEDESAEIFNNLVLGLLDSSSKVPNFLLALCDVSSDITNVISEISNAINKKSVSNVGGSSIEEKVSKINKALEEASIKADVKLSKKELIKLSDDCSEKINAINTLKDQIEKAINGKSLSANMQGLFNNILKLLTLLTVKLQQGAAAAIKKMQSNVSIFTRGLNWFAGFIDEFRVATGGKRDVYTSIPSN